MIESRVSDIHHGGLSFIYIRVNVSDVKAVEWIVDVHVYQISTRARN